MLSSGESMSFSVCRYGQPLVWSAFYLRLNVSFFKKQGERREAACAERQPKCGGKIIARFGVVRRAWGCGRHGSRYGCGGCRRCRRWFRCGRGRRFCCGRCGRFRRGRCGGLCSRCCRRFRRGRCGGFNGRCCSRLRGRGQFGRGDGEGGIQPVSVACHIQVLDGCTQRSIGNVPQHKFSSKSCVLWALGT